jgi:hypothetical protein
MYEHFAGSSLQGWLDFRQVGLLTQNAAWLLKAKWHDELRTAATDCA